MSSPELAADGLYSHLQSLRIDQGLSQHGLGCQGRMHRASSESPFAEPLTSSSAGGDVQSDNSSSEPSLLDGPQLHHSPSQPMPQTQSMLHDDFSSRPSLDGSQPKSSQICFDYTKGLCTRGDKCKYSHDLATIVHFNSKEKGICFDYLRNQCHRGLLCRFSHDLSNIAQQCQGSDVSAAQHQAQQQVFNNNLAKGKTNAICYDFVKGVCQRGNDCRYSHDLSLIARTARGGQQNQKSTEICYDYLRGRCNRGNGCKYSHNISFLATPSFLSNSLTGASSTGQAAPTPNPAAPTSVSLGGALPGAVSNPGNMHMGAHLPGQRLSPSISADPLSIAINSSISASLSPDLDNRTLNTALSQSDMQDMQSEGQPWSAHGGGAMPAAAVHALAVAAQRRQYAAAAAAAQINSYNHQLQQAMQMAGMDMNNGFSAVQQQSLASTLAAAQQQAAARAYLANQQNDGNNPALHRAQSAPLGKLASTPVVAESITTLLANLGDNPQLLAETLSGLAAAAQAQAAARMSAPGMSTGGNMAGVGHHSAPQSVPGCYEPGSGVPSPPFGSFAADGYPSANGPLLPAMSAPAPEQQGGGAQGPGSAANSLTAAALSPDLLPLLKEIWNK